MTNLTINENWRLLSHQNRADILTKACDAMALLTNNADATLRIFAHLLNQATQLDKRTVLTGATGESNELYIQARGKTLVVGSSNAQILPMLAQVLAALLTGNCVTVCCPSIKKMTDAIVLLQQAGVPKDVVNFDNSTEFDELFDELLADRNLAQVAMVAGFEEVQQLCAKLSKTDGMLTQVIAITDMQNCQEVFAPDYLHRFTTERVCTINTTAIGGNASLLELGAVVV